MRVGPVPRRAQHLAAVVGLALAAGLLLSAQPLRSPWWTGHDFDTVYGASAVSLFRGERSTFLDHPGLPLQETLAAALIADWALSDSGDSRSARANWFLSDLDRLRPHLRILGSLLFFGSALIAYAAVAWSERSILGGLFAGLVLLAAPDVTVWAAVVKPDPLLAALSVAATALLVEGARRRSGAFYVAAAAVIGYAITVKVHAVGLLAPLALAPLLWRPQTNGLRELADAARRHRVAVLSVAGVYLAAALVLNAFAASPALRPLALLVAALVVFALLAWAVWRVTRGTRVRLWVELGIALVTAGLAGSVLPNLLYANLPAPALRWLTVTLSGRGVEASTTAVPPWDVLESWYGVMLLALAGFVLALRARDRTVVLWLVAAAAMGLLALFRYGSVHYYTAAIALLAPLAVPALKALAHRPPILAGLAAFFALYQPFWVQVDEARDRGEIARSTERVNAWVEPRLRGRDVALTFLESDDSRTFSLVLQYAPSTPPRQFKFLPATSKGVEYAAQSGLDVRYVVTGAETDPAALLASLGVQGRATRVDAPGFVYRVEG